MCYLSASKGSRYAALNPISHNPKDTQIKRRFQTSARAHAAASAGSLGQARPGRYTAHSATPNNTADPANTQPLWALNATSQGAEDANDATAVPRPRLTSVMGSAQHTSVPVLANRASQLTPDSRVVDGSVSLTSDIRSSTET